MVHLDRDFQAMVDRDGQSAEVGRRLLAHSERVFDWWHRVRDGTMARATLQSHVAMLRFSFRDDLRLGEACGCAKTAATCRELLSGETHLWTFVRVEGIEPTNNDAERALRHGVIYRKISGGTDSESGSRFVERMLTVVATCRQQGINVVDYLTGCYQARLNNQPAPSLLPSESTSQAARMAIERLPCDFRRMLMRLMVKSRGGNNAGSRLVRLVVSAMRPERPRLSTRKVQMAIKAAGTSGTVRGRL